MPTTNFSDSSLSFYPSLWNNNNPTQHYLTPYNISTGNSSSPGSSSSESCSSSSCHENSNSPRRSPDTTTGEDAVGGNTPFLRIVEEPGVKFRFRYVTEMQGTHGAILGVHSKTRPKTYPRVQLCNYMPTVRGENPIIRCTLSTSDDDESQRVPHVHRLVGKTASTEKDDPHDIPIRAPNFTAIFQNLTILFTKKEDQLDFLVNKKINHATSKFTTNVMMANFDLEQMKAEAAQQISRMNLNIACLKFEALVDKGHGQYVSICPPVYSNPISNMKNAQTNELKICRVDHCMGPCNGGQEVFMFVEKVVKKNIRVKFYEEDEYNDICWSALAQFTPEDVHHQYGIVFKTPQYRDLNITENKLVYFQLERPSDNAVSAPMKYEYRPNRELIRSSVRKRPRYDSNSNYPATLNDFQTSTWNTPLLSNPSIMNDAMSVDRELIQFVADILESPGELPSLSSGDLVFDGPLGKTPNVSFQQMLDSLPSQESRMISDFIKQDRFKEWAMYNGEEDTVGEIMLGQASGSTGYHSNLQNALTVDGCLDFQAEHQRYSPNQNNEEAVTVVKEEVDQTELATDQMMECTLQNVKLDKTASPDKTLNQSDKFDQRQLGRPVFQMDQGSDSVGGARKLKLNENNIVEITDKAINKLNELMRSRRISEKRLQDGLKRLFAYSVGYNEDNVLHILAASDQSHALALKFVKMLKMYSVHQVVINTKNKKQETALHVAARKGTHVMVSMLLDAGANVNEVDDCNNTAAHLATLRRDDSLPVMTELLKSQPDLSICNDDGFAVLHLAVMQRKIEIVYALIIKSEDDTYPPYFFKLKQQDRKHGNTPLHIAVQERFADAVNALLNCANRIDVNAKNFSGKTPLAFVWGKTDPHAIEIQDLLLNSKADRSLIEQSNDLEKEEFKDEVDSDSELEIFDTEDVDETLSAYAREWEYEEMFDKDTITKLCLLLDEHGDWEALAWRLQLKVVDIEVCKKQWSPTLSLFNLAAMLRPELSSETIRDQLLEMPPHLHCGAQYIDDMLLQKLGI